MWLLSLTLAASAGDAPPPPRAEGMLQPQNAPAPICLELTGTESDRAVNAQRRHDALAAVRVDEDQAVDVIHHEARWQAPRLVEFSGADLVAVRKDTPPTDDDAAALVVLHNPTASCPAGRYLVRVDDVLGDDGRVLAVLPQGLLVEQHGALLFWPKEGEEPPHFRAVWRSSFWLSFPSSGGAPVAKGKAQRPPPKRRR
jgi:hypothetical protein